MGIFMSPVHLFPNGTVWDQFLRRCCLPHSRPGEGAVLLFFGRRASLLGEATAVLEDGTRLGYLQ